MVRQITVKESEFSELDRSLLLASLQAEREPRSDTGWLLSEATDPKNQGKFYAEQPAVDFSKKALLEGREAAEKIFKGKLPLDTLLIKVGKKD